MNTVRNYQKELDKIIERLSVTGQAFAGNPAEESKLPPTLLLHSCCAPCSSYVLEYLRKFFRITVFYYNPNISMEPEYRKRVAEQKRLIQAYNDGLVAAGQMPNHIIKGHMEEADIVSGHIPEADIGKGYTQGYPISIIEGDYEPEKFFAMAKGLEQCPEGGERCFACYELRLRETAKLALAGKFDYFTTTLTISPLKNAGKLNDIGERLAQDYKIDWLPSDFKKRGGYQRSIELSREYELYRQDYCGCIYSRRQ